MGLMDVRAARLLDSAFGLASSEISGGAKGARDATRPLAPLRALIYSERVGGVDELDRLRVGFRGFEGVGRARKRAARLFDATVNALTRAAYRAR